MTPRTTAGLVKYRPLRAGSRVSLVAPASPFDRAEFEAGLVELRRLGLQPVYDETVFERRGFLAGSAETRAAALMRAWSQPDVDAIICARGGYGSVEALPLLGSHVTQPPPHRTATEASPWPTQPAEASKEQPCQSKQADRLPVGDRVQAKNLRHQPIP